MYFCYNETIIFKFGGVMQADFGENKEQETEENTIVNSPDSLDPFYSVRKKKKRKKKKPFPTDPDDPETDDDFDEEDDDDDDSETSGDSGDEEDENELVQEEIKPQTMKDPLVLAPRRPENIDLKRQVGNPEKKQRSPLQKFFDVLLYGVQGAKLRNGDLSVKNSMFDELLLGLGFKAYLKDVLLNNQIVKYFKQKTQGKDNPSFLQKMFKAIKKKIGKNSELKAVLPDLKKKISATEKKTLTSAPLKESGSVEKKDILQILKTPQRPARVGAPVEKKEKLVLTKETAKKILVAVEKEEQRLKDQDERKNQEKNKLSQQQVQLQKAEELRLSLSKQEAFTTQDKLNKKVQQDVVQFKDVNKAQEQAERNQLQSERNQSHVLAQAQEQFQAQAQRVSAPVVPGAGQQTEKDQAMQLQAKTSIQTEQPKVSASEMGQVMAKMAEVGLSATIAAGMRRVSKTPLDDIVRATGGLNPALSMKESSAEATTVRVNEQGRATPASPRVEKEPAEQVMKEPVRPSLALEEAGRVVPTGPDVSERAMGPVKINEDKGK